MQKDVPKVILILYNHIRRKLTKGGETVLKFINKQLRNEKGFTLVELMVVVVIIGVLVAIAVPVYNSVTEKAERRAVEANLRIIDSAIMQYYITEESSDKIISSVDDLVPKYLTAKPEGPKGVNTYGITGEAPSQRATVSGEVGGKTLADEVLSDGMWGDS